MKFENREKIFVLCIVFFLSLMVCSVADAEVFYDDFNTPRDYIAEGVSGTGWDGFIGFGPGETVDALNADTNHPGELYIESTNAYWEPNLLPLGPFLYKEVAGDFIATVHITDFAGSFENRVLHNDSFIMARVADLDAAGTGEDYECVHYFPTWVGNMGRDIDIDQNICCGTSPGEAEWGRIGMYGMGDNTYALAREYIQLERRGSIFYFRISEDGVHWDSLDTSDSPFDVNGFCIERLDLCGLPLQVGLAHATYSSATGFVAFDDFSLIYNIPHPYARCPSPRNGAVDTDVYADLCWMSGDLVQDVNEHEVYIGTNEAAVTAATNENHPGVDLYIVSEPYCALGTLVFGTTYFWRVDEVNEPNRWPSNVWSFTTDTGKARDPYPENGATNVIVQATELRWIPSPYAVSQDVYIGTNEAAVTAATKENHPSVDLYTVSDPYCVLGTLAFGTTYIWRVDTNNGELPVTKGDIWSFTTDTGKARDPAPEDGGKLVSILADELRWTPSPYSISQDVYFGNSLEDVNTRTTPDINGLDGDANSCGIPAAYLPLKPDQTYYWRVDTNNGELPLAKGDIWRFCLLIQEIPVEIGNPTLPRYPTSGDPANTTPRSAWDMHYFNGRIYIGSGDYWENSGPTDVWTYDGISFVKEYTVDDEMIWRFFEYDNKLFIPGNDATEDWSFGNLYINDPNRDPNPGWIKLRTLPGCLHSFCVAMFKGKLYANMTTDGSTPDRILVSDDMGQSWTTLLDEYGSFVVFDDFLFINEDFDGNCYKYDGTTLQKVTPNLYPDLTDGRYMERYIRFQDGLLYAARYSPWRLENTPLFFLPASEIKDGGTATKVAKFATDCVHDIVVRDTTCYVLTVEEITEDVAYTGRIYSSTDITHWSLTADFAVPSIPLSFEIMNNKFYIGLGCVGPESGSIWEIAWCRADLDFDGEVNFTDYAIFAYNWMNQNCIEPSWCDGADLNKSGSVELSDVEKFVEKWLWEQQ